MVLEVRAVPKSSRAQVIKENNSYKVYLTKPAVEGQANQQLIGLLAEYFKVKKYQVSIIKGENSRNKLVRIS